MENTFKACLFKFHTRQEGTVMFESWSLPQSGQFDAKDFKTIMFYNYLEKKIDRMNIPTSDFEKIAWKGTDGKELPKDEISMLFVDLTSGLIPVVEFIFETKRSGRYSVDTITEIRLVDTLTVE